MRRTPLMLALTVALAIMGVQCPRIVYTDLNGLICKISFLSPARGA
jgi:hypothetical protein